MLTNITVSIDLLELSIEQTNILSRALHGFVDMSLSENEEEMKIASGMLHQLEDLEKDFITLGKI